MVEMELPGVKDLTLWKERIAKEHGVEPDKVRLEHLYDDTYRVIVMIPLERVGRMGVISATGV